MVPGAAHTVTGDRVTILLGGALTALVTVLAIRAWWTGSLTAEAGESRRTAALARQVVAGGAGRAPAPLGTAHAVVTRQARFVTVPPSPPLFAATRSRLVVAGHAVYAVTLLLAPLAKKSRGTDSIAALPHPAGVADALP